MVTPEFVDYRRSIPIKITRRRHLWKAAYRTSFVAAALLLGTAVLVASDGIRLFGIARARIDAGGTAIDTRRDPDSVRGVGELSLTALLAGGAVALLVLGIRIRNSRGDRLLGWCPPLRRP